MQAKPARYRCALAAIAILAPAIHAQPADRPTSSRRTVASYDFEEPDNPFEVPADFFRAQSDPSQGITRPGFPVFNQPAFSNEFARSGDFSVVLPIRRGSVSLRLRPGALPVFPDADYQVSCFLRGDELAHARFRLVGRLLDQNAEPIPNAQFVSEPAKAQNDWTRVEIEIPGGTSNQAAFLQIDAELVQPQHFNQAELGPHQIWPEDLEGRVWIDDLAVTQLPRLWIQSKSPGGIIATPDPTELQFLIRDLTGESLVARLTVSDSSNRVVFAEQRPVRSNANPQSWSIDLPRLGWYRAKLEVIAAGTVVGAAESSIAYVDAIRTRTDAEGGFQTDRTARFEFAIDRYTTQVLEALPHLGRAAATQGLTLGGWDETTNPDNIDERSEALFNLLASSIHEWIDPAIALHHVPDSLQSDLVIDSDDVIEALAEGRDRWRDYLDPMLDRLGQIATRWRIGTSTPGPDFPQSSGLDGIRFELASLIPGPRIGFVQQPHLNFPPTQGQNAVDEITLALEPGTGTHSVTDAVERFSQLPDADSIKLNIAYNAHHTGQFNPNDLAAELVKRIVLAEFAAQGNIRITHQIVDAWELSQRDRIIKPQPSLPAWRATIDRLEGRTVATELAVNPGVRAFLLVPDDPDDPRGGALVAWNNSAAQADAVVQTNLGEGAVNRVDIWGNTLGPVEATQLESPGGKPVRLHRLPVGHKPIFVEGIDVELAVFVASIRLDEPTIQTTPGPHTRNVLITNPWRVAIDGDVIVLEPSERLSSGRSTGWDITPRVSRFSVGPGETTQVPIDISFAAVELAGTRPFVVDVAIRSGPIQERLRAPSIMTLDLDGIELDARPVVARNGTDLALEAIVTNISPNAMDLTLNTAARGYPRQSAVITQLAPGASTVRRFVFPDGVARLSGSDLYLGVEDPARRGRYNRRISVD